MFLNQHELTLARGCVLWQHRFVLCYIYWGMIGMCINYWQHTHICPWVFVTTVMEKGITSVLQFPFPRLDRSMGASLAWSRRLVRWHSATFGLRERLLVIEWWWLQGYRAFYIHLITPYSCRKRIYTVAEHSRLPVFQEAQQHLANVLRQEVCSHGLPIPSCRRMKYDKDTSSHVTTKKVYFVLTPSVLIVHYVYHARTSTSWEAARKYISIKMLYSSLIPSMQPFSLSTLWRCWGSISLKHHY